MNKAIQTLRFIDPDNSRQGRRYLLMAALGLLVAIISALLSARG